MKQNEFYLIGYETRTDNKNEMSGQGAIPKMWEKVFKENLKGQVSSVLDDEIYAVYCNYESDEHGQYDYFVGYKVKDLNTVPDGLVGKKIMAGNYKKLETNAGPTYQVVGQLWMHIWKMSESDLGGKRAFQTDYEVYGARAIDPNHAVIEVYLGIQ